jgi:hypothetical protein
MTRSLTRNFFKTLLVNFIILTILVEVVSLAYISISGVSVGKYDKLPTYLSFSMQDEVRYLDTSLMHPRIVDSSLPWGIWHLPNVKSRQVSPCFDIVMSYNHFGSRGPEPDRHDTGNVLFLGDSFTEGFGLQQDMTIPAQFSKFSGKPYVNLGVSRTGSTQQALVYRHFADSFRHREVVMLLFLENDFIDNDYYKHDTIFTISYKPYRADSSDLSKIVYRGHPDSSTLNSAWFRSHIDENKNLLIRKGMKSYFAMDNLSTLGKIAGLTYSRRMVELISNGLFAIKQQNTVPPVLEYRKRDMDILTYDMTQIMDLAEQHDARVTFINLPGQRLLERLKKHQSDRKAYLALEERIHEIAKRGKHRFLSFYKELERSQPDLKEVFLKCDAHYTEKGAGMVANFVANHMDK